MTTLHVFDPAMCCPTGVCGPAVDPQLVRFAADLEWLKRQGVAVTRFNLAQAPHAFAEDEAVKRALEAKGEAALPLVKVNGAVLSSGTYPSRAELAAWVGVTVPAPTPSPFKVAATGCCGAPSASPDAPDKTSGCC